MPLRGRLTGPRKDAANQEFRDDRVLQCGGSWRSRQCFQSCEFRTARRDGERPGVRDDPEREAGPGVAARITH